MQETLVLLLNEIRSAWRFRWVGAGVAWLVCLLGWGWAAWQPNTYEGSATVFVDMTSVLRPVLGEQIIESDISTQLTYVRQALLGREHLERVARENGLDLMGADAASESGDIRSAAQDRLIENLREQISIGSSQAERGSEGSTYTIAFRHEDRETAVSVVRTLLNSLVENTLSGSREGSETAQEFIDQRIAEYEKRLREAEQALADFRRRHSDQLPGSEGDYFNRIQEQREELQATQRELRRAIARRDRLREQLNSEAPVVPGADGEAEPPPDSIDARIRDRRNELDRLLLEYTESHPDVRNARAALEQLEQQRAEQLESLGIDDRDQSLSNLGSNPVYQQIQIALNEVEVEISTLRADVEELEEELAELEELRNEVPEVEAELARLNRDYDVIYEQYQSLIRSRETQQLSSEASATDQVDFRVINPPAADFEPVSAPRLMLIAGVFFGGLGVGGGFCYLFSQIRPVFGDTRTLREVTGLPVLGTVSHAMSEHQSRILPFAMVMGCLALVFAALVGVELIGPGIHSFVQEI